MHFKASSLLVIGALCASFAMPGCGDDDDMPSGTGGGGGVSGGASRGGATSSGGKAAGGAGGVPSPEAGAPIAAIRPRP